MNRHWLLHNRRAQATQVTTGEWIELACMLSCWAIVVGFITAIASQVYWLCLVSLIPGALSILAAFIHDWSYEV